MSQNADPKQIKKYIDENFKRFLDDYVEGLARERRADIKSAVISFFKRSRKKIYRAWVRLRRFRIEHEMLTEPTSHSFGRARITIFKGKKEIYSEEQDIV